MLNDTEMSILPTNSCLFVLIIKKIVIGMQLILTGKIKSPLVPPSLNEENHTN